MSLKPKFEVMTVDHPMYGEFYDRLCGPEACNFRKDEKGPIWTCHNDKRFIRAIIASMGIFDVEASVVEIGSGMCCDCEVAFNKAPEGEDDEEDEDDDES